MSHRFTVAGLLMLGAALLLTIGCGSTKPSRFYMLSPIAHEEAETPVGSREDDPVVGVGPITFPRYLDRPQIVSRTSEHELIVADAHRWAEPLRDTFSRVLAENLALTIPTHQVALFPWKRASRIDYQVTIKVSRLDSEPNGDVVFIAYWQVFDKDQNPITMLTKTKITEPSEDDRYDAIVAAKSRAVATLSREIAQIIREAAASVQR